MNEKVLGMEANVALGLGYLIPIISLIILIVEKNMGYHVKFHVLQSLFLNLAVYVIAALTCGFGSILGVYSLVVAIFMFIGRDHRVPVICDLVNKCM